MPLAQTAVRPLNWDCPPQDRIDKELMKAGGWVEYSTNTPCVLYENEHGTQECWWVQYDIATANPQVEGSNGMDCPIYYHDLHADPKPLPNFNDAKGFQDN
jgi:hypothetical protein